MCGCGATWVWKMPSNRQEAKLLVVAGGAGGIGYLYHIENFCAKLTTF